jgi:hypothetical protein
MSDTGANRSRKSGQPKEGGGSGYGHGRVPVGLHG